VGNQTYHIEREREKLRCGTSKGKFLIAVIFSLFIHQVSAMQGLVLMCNCDACGGKQKHPTCAWGKCDGMREHCPNEIAVKPESFYTPGLKIYYGQDPDGMGQYAYTIDKVMVNDKLTEQHKKFEVDETTNFSRSKEAYNKIMAGEEDPSTNMGQFSLTENELKFIYCPNHVADGKEYRAERQKSKWFTRNNYVRNQKSELLKSIMKPKGKIPKEKHSDQLSELHGFKRLNPFDTKPPAPGTLVTNGAKDDGKSSEVPGFKALDFGDF